MKEEQTEIPNNDFVRFYGAQTVEVYRGGHLLFRKYGLGIIDLPLRGIIETDSIRVEPIFFEIL